MPDANAKMTKAKVMVMVKMATMALETNSSTSFNDCAKKLDNFKNTKS